MKTGSVFDALPITERDSDGSSVRFGVRVQPRSSRTGIDGMRGNALHVHVNAPPVDGAANDAVLAAALGVAKRAVIIIGGLTSRSKVVEVREMTAAEMRARLSS